MAQSDEITRTSDAPNSQRVQDSLHCRNSKAQPSPTFQQLLQRDGSKWSQISLQKEKYNDDHENHGNRDNKKLSVLAKVKEKAKRLKYSLRKKKGRDEHESRCPSTTRPSDVGPKDKEEDVEYHSARTYESKRTPTTNKHASLSNFEKNSEKNTVNKREDESANSGRTETHSKGHAPPSGTSVVAADSHTKNQTTVTVDVPKVHESQESNSRFLTVSTLESNTSKSDKSIEEGENLKRESQTWDKGVSVKEYLMHKFEPGEDERALSKVITQTISPRRDKMREAMSSFLKNEEPSEVNSSNVDDSTNLNFKSKSLPASTNLNNNTGSKLASIKQSYSLGSNASKASSNLNQTFKSTFASYQDHFLGSSSNHKTIVNSSVTSSSPNTNPGSIHHHFPTKTSSSPLGHASGANETRAAQDPVSSADQNRVSRRTVTSVRRVPVSRANQTWVPSHTETNTTQVPLSMANPGHSNATRTPVSTGNQGRFPAY